MVDTLAPKKVFSQRDLDQSLLKATPVTQSIMSPDSTLLSSVPSVKEDNKLLDKPQLDYVIDKNQMFNMMQNAQKQSRAMVNETNETVRSSQETIDTKQTGERTKQEDPQGLVMKPIEYAAKGLKDKNVSGPILTGEKGPELIVPTGDGKISILDAKTTGGLLTNGATQASSIVEKPAPKLKASPIEDEAFINYMKTVENAQLLAGDKSKLQHSSVEGGNDTVAFGHKLTDKEVSSGKVYGYDYTNLTTDQANDIFNADIKKAHAALIDKFGNQYTGLDNRRKQILIDFQYNLGSLNAFPKFTTALFAGDEATMMKEYKRFFKDPKSGDMKPLGRNKNFNDFFFDGKGIAMNSMMSQPIKKAEKGAENVEIGNAQPAGFFFRNPMTPEKPSGGEKLFNFLFPRSKNKTSEAMPNNMTPIPPVNEPPNNTSLVEKPETNKEPFDPNKLKDEDSGYGVNLDYYYDNREEMAKYTIAQEKGNDYVPSKKEIKEVMNDNDARFDAYWNMKSQEFDDEYVQDAKEDYIKPDPYDPLGKRKQELLDEYGPEILPEA